MDENKFKILEKDYNEKKSEIDAKYWNKIKTLQRNFARKHRRFTHGDIIHDHSGICILVEKINFGYSTCYNFPTALYFGPILKENGEKRGDNKQHMIFDVHAERVIE